MKRIVYFLPDIDAGVARIVKNLLYYRPANTLIQYAVVLFRQTDSEDNYNPVVNGLNADEIIRFGFKSTENSYAVYRRLKKVLHSDEDIIVSNDGFELKMIVACKLTNPVVYILHGDFGYYYNIVKQNQSVIDGIITYANKMEQTLHKVVDINNQHKISKIYYPTAIVQDKLREENHPEQFTILFAGTLDKRKGADILFAIYTEIRKLGITDFLFKIIGDGILAESLKEQFKDQPNIILTGWADNAIVLKNMSAADIFLFPSVAEGLPNVLVEALSLGAVPVSSNLESGVKDIIDNDVNGILVDIGDVMGFANAIASLYRNREKLLLLQSNSNIGLEKFNPQVQAAVYENKILNIAKKKSHRNFPGNYNMGRILNNPWLPNWMVKSIRGIVKHPKL